MHKKELINEDIEQFKKDCEKYMSGQNSERTNIRNILKRTIEQKNKVFFKIAMEKFISPEVFWSINKELINDNNYDFLKIMIKIYRNTEKNKDYINQLIFDFIEKDDLFFVSYLVEEEKAKTHNMKENELTVLNECVKSNSIKCFDYFLLKGKNIHDFDDLVIFTALDNKRYEILEIILSVTESINKDIEANFFKYGSVNNKEISNKNLLKLVQVSNTFLDKSTILQNGLNQQLISRGLFKELEKNLINGHSPIGDDQYDLMAEVIMSNGNKENNKRIKMIKLLLDYGSILTEDHKNNLSVVEVSQIENYPRFNKINQKLQNKLIHKGKTKINKI